MREINFIGRKLLSDKISTMIREPTIFLSAGIYVSERFFFFFFVLKILFPEQIRPRDFTLNALFPLFQY